jgi:cyclic-di-GMP phosphodiesterase TipF (flagellum assembly factor)
VVGSAKPPVSGLVYIFIALAALGVGAAAYFGLTFTPIEATVSAIAFAAVAVTLLERRLRQRSEARLERGIEDLARLLSTNAQAGQALGQRLNALTDANLGARLEGIEADISVLGTVVRQVAEAVAELEEKARTGAVDPATAVLGSAPAPVEADEDRFPEPVIPTARLRRALDENRLIFHVEPTVSLPQRTTFAHDLVPRLMLEEGGLAEAADFMPYGNDPELVGAIESMALDEAVVIARRSRTAGDPMRLLVPLSAASLTDAGAMDRIGGVLGANRAIAQWLTFVIPQSDWRALGPTDKRRLVELGRAGAGFMLDQATSLRFDFSELEGMGFSLVRFDASSFLRRPESFTDFHSGDVAPYASRFGIALAAGGVIDEQQLLGLIEDGIMLARGPHIGRVGPIRQDLVTPPPVRHAEPVRSRA